MQIDTKCVINAIDSLFYYSTTTAALRGGGSKKVNRTSRCAHMTLVGLRAAGDQLRLAREFAVLGDYDTSRVYYQGVLSQVSRYVWGAEAHAHARRPLAPLIRMDDLRFQIYLASHCRVRHVAVLPPPTDPPSHPGRRHVDAVDRDEDTTDPYRKVRPGTRASRGRCFFVFEPNHPPF